MLAVENVWIEKVWVELTWANCTDSVKKQAQELNKQSDILTCDIYLFIEFLIF